MLYKYYLPIFWIFSVRYNGKINIINSVSFFMIDVFPTVYIALALKGVDAVNIFNLMVSIFVMFCFYEIGYIFNELITTTFEKQPTLRIPEKNRIIMLKHIENMVTLRLVIGVIISDYLIECNPNNIKLFISMILILLISYSLHNYYRNWINLLTMGIEVTLKYMMPISLILPLELYTQAILMIIVSVTLLRVIEYGVKKKIIKHRIRNVDGFRIRYYMVSVILVFLIGNYYSLAIKLVGLLSIFLIYRIVAFLIMKSKSKIRRIINDNRINNKIY